MYQKTALDSGLRIITSTMPQTRSVSICFFIGIGSRYEDDKQAGISHFIEHLLFKGTEKRPTAADVTAAIEGVGGIINASTDKEMTVYWCKVAQVHFALALDVLTDMLLNSRFQPEEVEKERQVVIEEIHMTKDSPSQTVNLLIDEILFPRHPLGRDIAGTKESMSAISRKHVLDYLKSRYQPTSAVVTVAGNIEHGRVVEALDRALSGWTNNRVKSQFSPYVEQANPRLKLEKRDTEQAHLCLALPGVALKDPRRFGLDLMNVVLGEGMSSRLFTEIRDKRGLAYSISSYVDHFLDTGSLIVYAGVDPKKLETAVKAILDELAKMKTRVPDAELSKAKELAKGRMLLRMEDTRNVSGWLGGQEVLTGRVYNMDEVVGIIDAITTDQIKEIANELLVGEHLRLAVVGPQADGARLQDLLKL